MSGRAVRAIEKSLWVTCNVGRRIAARNTREGTRHDPSLRREQIARITPRHQPASHCPSPPKPPYRLPSPARCIRTITLFINLVRPPFSSRQISPDRPCPPWFPGSASLLPRRVSLTPSASVHPTRGQPTERAACDPEPPVLCMLTFQVDSVRVYLLNEIHHFNIQAPDAWFTVCECDRSTVSAKSRSGGGAGSKQDIWG